MENKSFLLNNRFNDIVYITKDNECSNLYFLCYSKEKIEINLNLLINYNTNINIYMYGLNYGNNRHLINIHANYLSNDAICNIELEWFVFDESNNELNIDALVQSNNFNNSINQQIRGYLFSNNGKINACPVLNIKNNLIKASHGVAVGNINKEQLFYLNTKCISTKEAKLLYIKSKFNQILPNFDNKIITEFDNTLNLLTKKV